MPKPYGMPWSDYVKNLVTLGQVNAPFKVADIQKFDSTFPQSHLSKHEENTTGPGIKYYRRIGQSGSSNYELI
jgi:hypothetical protein